jgi:hypothetical protein
MAVLNRHHGYLFLSEPHIASRAITTALLHHEGSLDIHQHGTLEQLQARDVSCDGLLKFSCIRHPCDWLVSHYLHLSSWHRAGFEAFLRYHLEHVFTGRTVFLHTRAVKKVLRYENLLPELNALLRELGVPAVSLAKIGVTPYKQHWSKYYDDTTRRLVRSALLDFDEFGYEV